MSEAALRAGRAAPPSVSRPSPAWAGDVAAFAVGLLVFLDIELVGRLFASEIVLLLLLAGLLTAPGRRRYPPEALWIFALGGLWLWSQIVTDLWRGVGLEDFSRGWLRIAVVLANLAALYLLLDDRPRRIRLALFGTALGLIVAHLVDPSDYAAGDPWKFGVGLPITVVLALAASLLPDTRRGGLAGATLLGAATALNLNYSFRSLAGICFLATALLVGRALWRTPRLRPAQAVAVCVLAVAVALGFVEVYASAAEGGMLGDTARHRYERTAGTSKFAFLVAGRAELFSSTAAIADAPVLGHGSYPTDPGYRAIMVEKLQRLGVAALPRRVDFETIPTHSHLFGAWVEAGVLGAVFWAAVLGLTGAALLALFRGRDRLAPAAALLGLLLAWDVLFSPFGAERRLLVPLTLVLLISLRRRLREPGEVPA